MKLEALDHPKTMELAAQLGVELPTAIGHLELLWAFTGKKTPCGDIGKWSDAVIASACYWRGTPSDFVQALIEARFVDADPECRLIVHDWHEHCPNWVRAKLKRDGVEFARLKTGLKTDTNDDSNGGTSRADLNQDKRSEAKTSGASALALHESLPEDAWDEWIEHRKSKRWPVDDRTLKRQLALLAKHSTTVQRQMIDTSIQAGWQGIFELKGVPRGSGKPSGIPDDRDREDLAQRAVKIGFRAIGANESVAGYRTLLEREELNRRNGNPALNAVLGSLVGGSRA